MSRRLFLSYSHLDHDYAEAVRKRLLGLPQVEVWKDTRELVPGKEWARPLWESLQASDAVVALLSANYVASEFCRQEAREAREAGVPFLGILFERCGWQTLGIGDKQLVQAEDPELTMIDVWDQPAKRSRYLYEISLAIERGLAAPDPRLILAGVPADHLEAAFSLAGLQPGPDPMAEILGAWEGPKGIRVRQELVTLGHPVPAPQAPGPRAGAPAPVEPAQPSSPWTRYWRDRLDRVEVWRPLAEDVEHVRRGDPDRAYLIVGEPKQQPEALVSRVRSHLPGTVSGEAQPAVVVVPFPNPDFVATTGAEVQRQVVMQLVDHPDFVNVRPDQGEHLVLRQAAGMRPVVIVLGPLKGAARKQERALVDFCAGLGAWVGAPAGRWPVRLMVVVEDETGGQLYGALLKALSTSGVALTDPDPLHFPSWEEVYGQLGAEARFAGLSEAQRAAARRDYNAARVSARDLYDLVNRLLAILDRAKES